MHEASLMRDLMRKIHELAEREGGGRIIAVRVWLGALSHMSPAHFREHFDESSAGSLAEGAELRIESSDDITDEHAEHIMLQGIELSGA